MQAQQLTTSGAQMTELLELDQTRQLAYRLEIRIDRVAFGGFL